MLLSRENLIRFIKFGMVGGLGTVINLSFFYVTVDTLGMNANLGSVLGFLIAVTSNYLLNSIWTFNDAGGNDAGRSRKDADAQGKNHSNDAGNADDDSPEKLRKKRPVLGASYFLKYVGINVFGLGLNLLALNIIIMVLDPRPQVIAQAGGIASAMLSNFLLSKYFVFEAS